MDETGSWVIFFSFVLMSVILILFVAFWIGRWVTRNGQGKSPYTGHPLRRATDLSYFAAEKTLRFLYDMKQYDNKIFKLKKAAFCRETGRIFQDCVTWYDAVIVDWTFLQKRYPGHYVSWGSLSREQQQSIKEAHLSLDGFQTNLSSTHPAPRAIEPEFIYTKPGPLYVDLETQVLLGWKIVPGTDLELLIVQKPQNRLAI